MKPVIYCIPTYRSFEHCVQAVASALASSLPPTRIVIADDSGDSRSKAHFTNLEKIPNVDIWYHPRRLGVAANWNLFIDDMFEEDAYTIIANDDVFVHTNTIELICKAADASSDYFFCGDGESGNAFSLFLFKKEGYADIGPFDENFYPAYFEDNDMAYRLKLAGQKLHFVPGAKYTHIGSSTLSKYTPQESEQHHRSFRTNQQYYVDKWAGLPGQEKYISPFNR